MKKISLIRVFFLVSGCLASAVDLDVVPMLLSFIAFIGLEILDTVNEISEKLGDDQ